MAASIRSLVNALAPITGASRDDLRAGDVVTLQAADTSNTTYAWSIAYKPDGSAATLSGDPTLANPGTFTVDLEGPYLIRLITDLGLPSQSQQFVRLRFLSILGDLRYVSAGEQTDSLVPVPVDLDNEGWADDQNFNLGTLLGLIKPVVQSGRVYYVDQNDGTEGHADYSTIQAAITAAAGNSPTVSTPWVIMVRPGLYQEDLTFAPHVHVVGWPGNSAGSEEHRAVTIRAATPNYTTRAALAAPGDRLVLANLTFECVSSGAVATLQKDTSGTLVLYRTTLIQNGTDASQGPALYIFGGDAIVEGCRISMGSGAPSDRPALQHESAGNLYIRNSLIEGPSGILTNTGFVSGVNTEVINSQIRTSGDYGITTDSETFLLEYSRVTSASNPVLVHPSASVTAANVGLTLRWSFISGDISFDTTNIGGTSTLDLGSSEYGTLTYPSTAPTVTATTKATSLFYDNTLTAITAENVQDALEEIHGLAVLVTTLDDAYDGGVAASGSGRTIIADQGAVQIVDAASPSDPPPPANTNGNLEVVGAISSGSLTTPEIKLDPNPYGNGPLMSLGNAVTAINTSFGSSAIFQANSTGTPLFRNYNLRIHTQSTDGGGDLGRLILRGGDGLTNGGSTPDAGSLYLQGGSGLDATAGDAGSIFLAPGNSQFSSVGSVVLVRPEAATAATLTAAGSFVGGVTGTIRLATDMGAIEVDIDAADNLAAVLGKFDATKQVTAVDSGGGVIRLTTVSTGVNAEIYYLNDTVSGTLDTALGGFDGQAQVDGTWPESISITASDDNEISFGIGGGTGPMVYNSDTGKLTVPGLIDPTGLIFVQAAEPATAASEGAIWVSDGSGGLTAGNLYYRAFGGSVTDLSSGGGGGGGGASSWSFQTLSEAQLDDTNDSLAQAGAFYLEEQPTSGDTLVVTDGSTTRTYGFGAGGDVTVTIGGDVDETLLNLSTAITSDGSGLWDAVLESTLQSINDGTGSVSAGLVLVIYRANQSAASYDDRLYGTFTTGVPTYVNYNGETSYESVTTTALPGADPSQKEFGPGVDSPVQGQAHVVLTTNAVHTWDGDGGAWSQPPGSKASTQIWVVGSSVVGSSFANGIRYYPLASGASDFVEFQVVASSRFTLELVYAMSSASASLPILRVDSLVLSEGEDPTTALTAGTPFTINPGNDVLLHTTTGLESADLSLAASEKDLVMIRITRTDAAHPGDLRLIEVRLT